MDIKKFAIAAGIAVSAALIVSACQESPTASDSVANETAVLGQTFAAKPAAKPAAKVDVCHLEGNGSFHLINVSGNALAAHLAHGDVQPGDDVPGNPGKKYSGSCAPIDPGPFTVSLTAEANGQTATLSCDPGGEISVVLATYGGNCTSGGPTAHEPWGPIEIGDHDVTAHLASHCDGNENYTYTVDAYGSLPNPDGEPIGDPNFGCPKTYVATWACK